MSSRLGGAAVGARAASRWGTLGMDEGCHPAAGHRRTAGPVAPEEPRAMMRSRATTESVAPTKNPVDPMGDGVGPGSSAEVEPAAPSIRPNTARAQGVCTTMNTPTAAPARLRRGPFAALAALAVFALTPSVLAQTPPSPPGRRHRRHRPRRGGGGGRPRRRHRPRRRAAPRAVARAHPAAQQPPRRRERRVRSPRPCRACAVARARPAGPRGRRGRHENVEYRALFTPNDPLLPQQWGMRRLRGPRGLGHYLRRGR